jgi:hypothetical protein
MNKLNELFERAIAANKGREAAAKKNVNEILSVIFAEIPRLNLMRVRGYTPSFNDGDPCTHSQIVAVDVYDPDSLFEFMDEDDKFRKLMTGERFSWAHTSWDHATKKYVDNALPEDPHHVACIKARAVVDALEGDFEIMFDTNFTLDIVRDPNSEFGFRIDHSDYDCGY